MKQWKVWAVSLLFFALCACAREGTASGTEGLPVQAGESALSWDSLAWSGSLELTYAQQFSVDYAQEGFARIIIDGSVYLLVPEDGLCPADVPEEVVVLRRPLENIYLQATAAMDCFRQLDAIDAVTLSGTQEEGWYIPEARQAMEDGRMVYAGKYSAPDYELIKSQNCDLALESTMIYQIGRAHV